MSEIRKYCKVSEAAKYIKVAPTTILAMLKDGRLKGKQFTGGKNSHYHVERESVEAWIK